MKKKLAITIAIITVLALIILAATLFSSSRKKEIQIQQNAPAESNQESNEDAINNADDLAKAEPKEKVNENNNDASNQVQKTSEPKSDSFKITDRLVSWGFQKATDRKIDTIVIHSSYNSLGGDTHDLNKILDIYKSYGVSPHYIISREGKAYRLVEDKNVAYHAGESKTPDGRNNVNNFSIGIEIVNTKSENPSQAQYDSLKNLLKYLKNKYRIKYILGHSDIASGRKDDPWNFDWSKIK